MSRDLVTVGPSTPLPDAAVAMARRRVRHVLVVDPAGPPPRLVGLLSARDLLHACDPGLNPFSPAAIDARRNRMVRDVMVREPRTVSPTTSIDEAARFLHDHKIGALPVVDGGRLLGIVTSHDILRAFLDLCGSDRRGCRITFEAPEEGEDTAATIAGLARRHGVRVQTLVSLHRDGRRLAVVDVAGPVADDFLDAIWRSGNRVLRVQMHGAS